jgi:hypothetical protein
MLEPKAVPDPVRMSQIPAVVSTHHGESILVKLVRSHQMEEGCQKVAGESMKRVIHCWGTVLYGSTLLTVAGVDLMGSTRGIECPWLPMSPCYIQKEEGRSKVFHSMYSGKACEKGGFNEFR